jgi:hypothetical protein
MGGTNRTKDSRTTTAEMAVLAGASQSTDPDLVLVGKTEGRVFVALAKKYMSGGRVPLSSQVCTRIARENMQGKQPATQLNILEGKGLLTAESGPQTNKTRVINVGHVVSVRVVGGGLKQIWPEVDEPAAKQPQDIQPEPASTRVEAMGSGLVELTVTEFAHYRAYIEYLRELDFRPVPQAELRKAVERAKVAGAVGSVVNRLEKKELMGVASGRKGVRTDPALWVMVIAPVKNKKTGETYVPQECHGEQKASSLGGTDGQTNLRSRQDLKADLVDLREQLATAHQTQEAVNDIEGQLRDTGDEADRLQTQLAENSASQLRLGQELAQAQATVVDDAELARLSEMADQLQRVVDEYDQLVGLLTK